MKYKPIICTILILGSIGCASVPDTQLRIIPKTGEVRFSGPKDVTLTNLNAVIDGTKVSVKVGAMSAKNSPDVIAAVAAANEAMAEQLVRALQILGSMAAKGVIP